MSAKIPVKDMRFTISRHAFLTPTVFELVFTGSEPLEFRAGQFISVIVPGAGPNGRDLRRAYSIASRPEEPNIELCIKLVEGGPGTNYLNGLKPGDSFRGLAPYGDFVYKPKPGRDVCWISTGTGIAPFRSMMDSKLFQEQRPSKTICFFGVRTVDEMLYAEEFREKLGASNFISYISQAKPDEKLPPGLNRGRITDGLRALGDAFPWTTTDFYMCGNGAMITEVTQILQERGVQKDAIHKEKYY